MVVATILRVIGAVLLGGAVAGSLAITRHLSLLETGIQKDLEAVAKIVAVEREIQSQNEVLTDMVAVTRNIGTGLDGVLAASGRIEGQVAAMGEANRATLTVNQQLAANNDAAASDMARVVAALRQMNGAVQAIDQYLAALRETVAGDERALEAIAANTARMNLKTPEVSFR